MIDTKALREKVLDLAIRGKLVPQDPNDEPASVLLERIRQQKQQMVKEGKLKAKDIKNDTVIFVGEDNLHYEKFADGSVKCIEDEIPFELPEGWQWVRLGCLAQYKKGPFGSSITKAMFVPDNPDAVKVYEQKNAINKDASLGNYFISAEKYETLKGFEVFPNDIIVSCAGTIGETYVLPTSMRKGVINQALMKISLYDLGILDFYLMYFDFQLKRAAQEQGYGVALKNIPPFDMLKRYLVPIPPIQEQQRIIAAVNNLLFEVDSIDADSKAILALIAQTKAKILDLAIRGQLVPQDPSDEPASVLLERIRAEKEELIKQGKIKRDKKESVIFKGEDNSYYEKIGTEVRCINSEIPFDLPETWCWCRLGTLFAHNAGKALNSSDSAGTSMTYITTSNLYWDRFELDSLKEMPFTDSEIDKCTVTKGDLLVCEGGDIGRSAIWMFDENIRIQNHIHRLRPYISLSSRFYYYVMYMWKQLGLIGGQGIGLQGFSSKALHNLIVPFPSIDEQERIVGFVDELFETIANIERSLI